MADSAVEVVVYAKITTGYITDDASQEGTLFVRLLGKNPSVQDHRDLFYRIYRQSALSYNSNNFEFPVISSLSKTVEDELVGPIHIQLRATVQIVGQHTMECH